MDDTSIWTQFAAGDEDARQRVLTEHLGLVHFVARQLARGLASAAEYDELVSCGTIGLMSALENFEPARGLAFSTFAAPRIRGAILDELRRHVTGGRGEPPVLALWGENDLDYVQEQAPAFAEHARNVGVAVAAHRIPGVGHFYPAYTPLAAGTGTPVTVEQAIETFLESVLANASA